MRLKLLPQTFGILKLKPPQSFPTWLDTTQPFFVAQTSDEFSVMCPQDVIPDDVEYSKDYRVLRADGDLAFNEVGVVARLSHPLAEVGMSLFLVSTHDRDYVFVSANDLKQAMQIYTGKGFTITL